MKLPKISVIVPIYKVEKYLEECVNSICNQTYKNLEILLIDDGSPDKCPEICEKLAKKDGRITVFHKQNGGVSSARNFGIDKATGELITFVDSDDCLEKTMYEKMVEKICEDNSDIVISRYKHLYKNCSLKVFESDLGSFCKTKDLSYLLCVSNGYKNGDMICVDKYVMCSLCRMIFKNDLLQNIRFNEKISIFEDQIFFIKTLLSKETKISLVDEYLYNYRIRKTSALRNMTSSAISGQIVYMEELEKMLGNTQYKKYLSIIKYNLYKEYSLAKKINKASCDLTQMEGWNTDENYKLYQSHISKLSSKIKTFFFRHKMFFAIKIYSALKSKKIKTELFFD